MSALQNLNLSVKLATKDGRLVVEEPVAMPDDPSDFMRVMGNALSNLAHRLEVLERDGPWKPEVQNSLTAPSKPLWDACPKLSDL